MQIRLSLFSYKASSKCLFLLITYPDFRAVFSLWSFYIMPHSPFHFTIWCLDTKQGLQEHQAGKWRHDVFLNLLYIKISVCEKSNIHLVAAGETKGGWRWTIGDEQVDQDYLPFNIWCWWLWLFGNIYCQQIKSGLLNLVFTLYSLKIDPHGPRLCDKN